MTKAEMIALTVSKITSASPSAIAHMLLSLNTDIFNETDLNPALLTMMTSDAINTFVESAANQLEEPDWNQFFWFVNDNLPDHPNITATVQTPPNAEPVDPITSSPFNHDNDSIEVGDMCYFADTLSHLQHKINEADSHSCRELKEKGYGYFVSSASVNWAMVKRIPYEHMEQWGWDEERINKYKKLRGDLKVEPTPTPTPQPAAPQDAFGMMLDSMINAKLSELDTGVDEKIMAEEIKKQLRNFNKPLKITAFNNDPVIVENPHQSFEEMMHWIAAGENVMLTGPAGSGKTTAGRLAAEALNRRFGSISLSNDTRAYALFGFTNGQTYTTTEFRELYENGGVFVLDEVDNGQANILSKLNSALENGRYAFDDKVVERHPDFVCISTANTWGHGGDREYVGRNALDAAFLDRFIKIDWGYDEKLELLISSNEDFTRKIQTIRKAAKELKYKIVVSPRASIRGGRMLDANIKGMSEKKILDAVLWRGVADNIRKKIEAKVQEYANAS